MLPWLTCERCKRRGSQVQVYCLDDAISGAVDGSPGLLGVDRRCDDDKSVSSHFSFTVGIAWHVREDAMAMAAMERRVARRVTIVLSDKIAGPRTPGKLGLGRRSHHAD